MNMFTTCVQWRLCCQQNVLLLSYRSAIAEVVTIVVDVWCSPPFGWELGDERVAGNHCPKVFWKHDWLALSKTQTNPNWREWLQVQFDLIGSVPLQMPEATRTRNLKSIRTEKCRALILWPPRCAFFPHSAPHFFGRKKRNVQLHQLQLLRRQEGRLTSVSPRCDVPKSPLSAVSWESECWTSNKEVGEGQPRDDTRKINN